MKKGVKKSPGIKLHFPGPFRGDCGQIAIKIDLSTTYFRKDDFDRNPHV